MGFGDVIKSAPVSPYRPFGIGGNANVVWQSEHDDNVIYELSTTDLSVVRFGPAPGTHGYGIGGDEDTLWWCRGVPFYRIYELDTLDFSSIRFGFPPSNVPIGIGGDANTIWHYNDGYIYELSTTDFSAVRSGTPPELLDPWGIGGNVNIIWHYNNNLETIYELSTIDFSTVRSASGLFGGCGIGGDTNTIWWVKWLPGVAYELDASAAPFAPTGLLCCNKASSIGPTGLCVPAEVNRLRPYFSAIYNDPASWDTGVFYQIQVSNSTSFLGELLWDSSKIAMSPVSEGNRCENISYAGSSLSTGTIFYWRIKFWNNEGYESSYSNTACFRITSAGPYNLWCERTKNPTNVSDPQPEFSAINR